MQGRKEDEGKEREMRWREGRKNRGIERRKKGGRNEGTRQRCEGEREEERTTPSPRCSQYSSEGKAMSP